MHISFSSFYVNFKEQGGLRHFQQQTNSKNAHQKNKYYWETQSEMRQKQRMMRPPCISYNKSQKARFVLSKIRATYPLSLLTRRGVEWARYTFYLLSLDYRQLRLFTPLFGIIISSCLS